MNISAKKRWSFALLLLILGTFLIWNDWQEETVEALNNDSTTVIRSVSTSDWVIPTPNSNILIPSIETMSNRTEQVITLLSVESVDPTLTAIATEAVVSPTALAPTATLVPTLAVTATPILSTPPTIALPDGDNTTGGVLLLRGSATPNSTLSILTNEWTVAITTADQFGRWEQSIFFGTAATYEIFARELNMSGLEVSASEPVLLQVNASRERSVLPENVALAVSSPVERCVGKTQSGMLLPNDQYRIGVCQSLTNVGRIVGVYIELLLAANPQITNPSLIHPGQIINLP